MERVGVKQIVRSSAQYVGGLIVSLPVFVALVEMAGVDYAEASETVRRAVELVAFVAYIGAVRLLETHVSPHLGWLNGLNARVDYEDRPTVFVD